MACSDIQNLYALYIAALPLPNYLLHLLAHFFQNNSVCEYICHRLPTRYLIRSIFVITLFTVTLAYEPLSIYFFHCFYQCLVANDIRFYQALNELLIVVSLHTLTQRHCGQQCRRYSLVHRDTELGNRCESALFYYFGEHGLVIIN